MNNGLYNYNAIILTVERSQPILKSNLSSSSMVYSIADRLSQAEKTLVQAAEVGGPALAAFSDQLTNLLIDIDHEIQAKETDEQTIATWGDASWRLLQLNEQLFDIQTAADALFSTVQTEMDTLFSRMDLQDMTTRRPPPSCRESPSQSPDPHSPSPNTSDSHVQDVSAHPPYIESAYVWLLKNLHNPYPSKNTRETMAHTTGSDRKAIDSWFVDARKRIGWNTLRKQHFSNKRVDMVDAATRFFLHPDDKHPVDANLESEFAAIERRAKGLYSDMSIKSTLVASLDVAVKDSVKAQAKEHGRRYKSSEDQAKQDTLAAASYPSPAHSPSPSREPPAVSLVSDNNSTTSESIIGLKRRKSSANPNEDTDLTSASKPHKRARYVTTVIVFHALI